MSKAVLNSNNGWQKVLFLFSTKRHEEWDIEIAIKGDFWERSKEIEEAEVTRDFDLVLRNISLLTKNLDSLLSNCEAWLDNYDPFDLTLIEDPGCLLRISISKKDSIICSREKPVFDLIYKSNAINVVFSMIIDVSCVQIFIENLKNIKF